MAPRSSPGAQGLAAPRQHRRRRSCPPSAIRVPSLNTNITRTARFTGVDEKEEKRLQEKASRLYGQRNFPPEKVAEAVIRAVIRNQAVVPVTPEAHGARLLSRFTPKLLRATARIRPM